MFEAWLEDQKRVGKTIMDLYEKLVAEMKNWLL